jgi:GntR family transcriptional repressor for pyruvate dehydrogenase complex
MELSLQPFQKVRSTRAQELILDQLQNSILSGQYPPGSRLPSERAMMATFGVSRPTVREALRVAESMGLITVRHGDPSGPRVLAMPSVGLNRMIAGLLRNARTSRLDLLQLRIALELASTVLACHQPADRLAPAEEIQGRMRACSELTQFAQYDAGFHRALLNAGGNAMFDLVYEAIEMPMQGVVTHFLSEEGVREDYRRNREAVLQEHEDILGFIHAGKVREVQDLFRGHMRRTFLDHLDPTERFGMERFLAVEFQPLPK